MLCSELPPQEGGRHANSFTSKKLPFCRASWRAKNISPVFGMLRFASAWKPGNEIWDEKPL